MNEQGQILQLNYWWKYCIVPVKRKWTSELINNAYVYAFYTANKDEADLPALKYPFRYK